MASASGNESPKVGKRIGGTLYVHLDALERLPRALGVAAGLAQKIAGIADGTFNVVKLEGNPPKRVSLLAYDKFDVSPFPALLDSWTVDLAASCASHRTYRTSANPPILHRKELLLEPNDPRCRTFTALTFELDQRGLFANAKSIGFRRQWDKRLAQAGVKIRNHQVVEVSYEPSGAENDDDRPVKRHRTAMSRSALSAPMQALARHELLEDRTVFDYGCGRGDDLAVLTAAGISAKGWDPHFMPHTTLEKSDVVNLGYVLNVIEDPDERTETLKQAFGLAHQVLAVAVMIAGMAITSGLKVHRDGFLTSRGTFQKYFAKEHIQRLIVSVTGQEAIPLAPGIFLVFRDKVAEQRFLEARHRRRRDISHLLAITPSAPEVPKRQDEILLEENREIIESVWHRALELGRLPHLHDLVEEIGRELTERIGSVRKAAQLAQHIFKASALAEARAERVEDLQVYFALNLFNQRKRYRELPPELQRDIKAFFGSHTEAELAGRDLLFSLGDSSVIHKACQEAADGGFGYLHDAHSLQLDARLIDRLPSVLRIYIGCAEQLYGDIGEADLVKIHINSGKLTLLRYEKYKQSPLPLLRERIKIKLRDQDIDFFEYGEDGPSQILYLKTRYMKKDQPGYARQHKFDNKLLSLGIFNFENFGPSIEEFMRGLASENLVVRDFKIMTSKD
jgi:DNA phosphorothioation-associated putative methyltransferase